MEKQLKPDTVKTTEEQKIISQREVIINNNIYLVTSHYLGDKTLEETLNQAIKREAVAMVTNKGDENPSRKEYNRNSNIYSR